MTDVPMSAVPMSVGPITDVPTADVAAFDVDGTLTDRDCVGPFLRRVGGLRAVVAAPARRPLASLRAALQRDRDRLKEIVVGGVLEGRSTADVEAAGTDFAEHTLVDWLRPDTVARLRWHQRSGHRVVLVSASLRVYLEPLGRRLDADAVLCTDVERIGDRFGRRLAGGNCRGPRKAQRLRTWLDDQGCGGARLWAYGDSAGDREMLAMADHPQLVRRLQLDAAPSDCDTAPVDRDLRR